MVADQGKWSWTKSQKNNEHLKDVHYKGGVFKLKRLLIDGLRFSDKGPPYIEEEEDPRDEGSGICFPIGFARGHAVLVDFPDPELA